MQNGQCVEQNRAAQLLTAPTHPYTQKLLNSEPSGNPVPLPVGQAPLLEVENSASPSYPQRYPETRGGPQRRR